MSPTEDLPHNDPAAAGELIQAAGAVLFDFDGPLCDAFSGHPAVFVADELKKGAKSVWGDLPRGLDASVEAHAILRGLALAYSADRAPEQAALLHAELEKQLTQHEEIAVSSARPTPYAAELTVALRQRGKRLLVTTNNAAGAVRGYLRAQGIEGLFDHVIGRDPSDPSLMKPDPYCVNRAVSLARLPARSCLMIGDQASDAEAARAAGVQFLGYAPDLARAAALASAGVENVVSSLGDVLKALESQNQTGVGQPSPSRSVRRLR
ncbi:HAD family hydrolase [Streptomyces albidus (ex Kaewkla and Franco 2022)]|uniref:HAD family hydrolase n=1 Tax=Streptomyces albidus (ex Kaewkla and Franco 2022) TaxID=722709 RepID=UPI0015EF439C|nr:HAD family hydrolase [Streptomyces albidus (ex Kaewkla and Franco 2022)]